MYKRVLIKLKRVLRLNLNVVEVGNNELSKEERMRLEALPRYEPTETFFFGKKIHVVDPPTFLSSYAEIFKEEIYKFVSAHSTPIIIDCGANIGLATIYFKQLYPNAIVYAYEPDPDLFEAMRLNIASFNLESTQCFNNAVSNKNDGLLFHKEGGHSGMLVNNEGEDVIKVESVRLRDILEKETYISFLKIDIEGHEGVVLNDIRDQLYKVEHLFVEYHSFIGEEQLLADILKLLTTAGFRYYIKEGQNKKLPFIQREIFLEMDLLLNIFCYRN
jgi:FkbM family methyltransferase